MLKCKAIIADDEQPLRSYLAKRLQHLWPELIICGQAADGEQALALLKKERPDIAFLDIRMPGLSGLEVAKHCPAACQIVFITAFDQYAVEAFENAALDYLVKPVSDDRLEKTITRLKNHFHREKTKGQDSSRIHEVLQALEKSKTPTYLQWIRAQHGEGIKLIPVGEVCFFQAQDKYTVVMTPHEEFVIRISIKKLIEELDPDSFWQIHRKTIVNVHKIASISRSFTGRYELRLTDHDELLTVSRTYSHLFRQM